MTTRSQQLRTGLGLVTAIIIIGALVLLAASMHA